MCFDRMFLELAHTLSTCFPFCSPLAHGLFSIIVPFSGSYPYLHQPDGIYAVTMNLQIGAHHARSTACKVTNFLSLLIPPFLFRFQCRPEEQTTKQQFAFSDGLQGITMVLEHVYLRPSLDVDTGQGGMV
jgi:hypothetical protein